MDHLRLITTLTTLRLTAELCLHIISFLPIFHILRLRLISRAWNLFIIDNESSLFRAAAVLHGFAARDQSLEECIKQESAAHAFPLLGHVTSWKELYRSHHFLEMRCTGQLRARRGEISSVGGQVDQFKIDDEQRTVIATTTRGGLYVADIQKDEILWSIGEANIRENARCEFGGGFLIFDRLDYSLEVWRRKRDWRSDPLPSAPDDTQGTVASKAIQTTESARQDDRGAFVPFRIISLPNEIQASRFIYPTLVVVVDNGSGQEAWFFDICTGELSQKIPLVIETPHIHSITATCVDFNVHHVFVTAHDDGLVIFLRNLSCEPSYLQFQPAKQEQRFTDAFDLYHLDTEPLHSGDGILEYSIQSDELQHLERKWLSNPCAVRVSPCGSHVVLTAVGGPFIESSTVYIIHGFEDVLDVSHDPPSCSITLIIVEEAEIGQLAFEENKIAFHAAEQYDNDERNFGVLIIPFTPPEIMPVTASSNDKSEHPWLRIFQVYPNAQGIEGDVDCSCIQVNKTGVWYTSCELKSDAEGALQVRTLRYVDFTCSPAKMVRFYGEIHESDDEIYKMSSSDDTATSDSDGSIGM